MDERLLALLREGDPAAVEEVKRQLRPFATRVLASPLWSLQGARQRSDLEHEAVLAALRSSADDQVGLVRETLHAAALLGLRRLRAAEGLGEADHPPEGLMVGVALQSASAAQAAQLRRHLDDCAACRRHQEHVEEALRSASRATPAPAPLPPEAQTPAEAQPKPRAPTPPPPRRAPRPAKARPPVWPLLALGALCGLFAWWQAQPTEEQLAWHRASLLPGEIPPTDRAERYSGEAQAALVELRAGRCPSAATRLRVAAREAPEDLWLRWYEGLAYVCARDGMRALEALDAAAAMPEGPPFGMPWWRAQALVLEGRTPEALRLLDELAASEHPRAAQARLLAVRLRE